MRAETDLQQNGLLTEDERDFIATVRDSIVSADPRFDDDPTLLDRLASAHSAAKRLGLTDDALSKFLYLEMVVPGFYCQPVISNWLQKPGVPVDDRFNDLLDVLRMKLDQDKGDR
jgi:hypothetical protein